MKGTCKRAVAIVLTCALAFSASGVTGFAAKKKAKTPTLNRSSVSLKVGGTTQLKVKANGSKIKNTTWSVNKPAVAKVSKKGKVTALSVGTAKVSAKIKLKSGKTVTKKCTVKVADNVNLTQEWLIPTDVELDDDLKELVAKSQDQLAGATYEPVAIVGYRTKLNVGTDYRILCIQTLSDDGASQAYALVDVSVNVNDGTAAIIGIKATQVAPYTPTLGGWVKPAHPDVADTDKNRFQDAVDDGVSITPIALLATKTEGNAMVFFCSKKIVTLGAKPKYSIEFTTTDASGKMTIDFTKEIEVELK